MRTDFSKYTYKKTYDGDYTKSYKDIRAEKLLSEERRQEYDRVSKKLDEKPYNKSEKSSDGYAPIRTTEKLVKIRVSSAGPIAEKKEKVRNSPSSPIGGKTNLQKATKKNEKDKDWWDEDTDNQKLKDKQSILESNSPKSETLNYIDQNSKESPIEAYGESGYKDRYTGKIITLEQARTRLFQAGYSRKTPSSLGIFILLCFIASVIPILGPVILIAIGNGMKKNTQMNLEKHINGRTYFFSIAATETVLQEYKKKGNIAVVLGVIFLLFHIRTII